MKMLTWAVMQDCRLVGYVQAYSEWDAMKIAEKQYGGRLFVERTYLDERVTEGTENVSDR